MLSIAICTYNRAEQLELLLEGLCCFSSWLFDNVELIVIDNNCSDSTAQLLNEYQQRLPLLHVVEKQQGLANARNRALKEFKSSAILFIDDDTSINKESLQTYVNALKRFPQHGYFGGTIFVDWQNQQPRWLKSDDLVLLNGLFGHYDLGNSEKQYLPNTLGPFGANFLLRRSTIDAVGEFNSTLGVSGHEIGRGEETDYFKRSIALGFSGLYLPKAEVGHRFQLERISIPYLFKYGIAKGQEYRRTTDVAPKRWLLNAIAQSCLGVGQLLKGRRDRFYQCVINVGAAYGARKLD